MTVKLSRYIFRKINGRIIPIRKELGEASKTVASYSRSAVKKLNLLLKSDDVVLTKKFNLRKRQEFTPSMAMNKFMNESGHIRIHSSSDNLNIDMNTKPTMRQIEKLKEISEGKSISFDSPKKSGDAFSVSDALRRMAGLKDTPVTKQSAKLSEKALDRYGETYNPDFAGYINKEGSMLNFHQGSGMRDLDHRDVSDLVSKPPLQRLKDSDIVRRLSTNQAIAKRERAKSHYAYQSYQDILKLKAIKKGDILHDVKGDLIKSEIQNLKRQRNADKFLKKLKGK